MNTFGRKFRVSIFGESHGPAIGVTIDGVLPGLVIDPDELKKEIQDYVKKNTAPYKYPRIVEFRESLPKTISGKIIRNQL